MMMTTMMMAKSQFPCQLNGTKALPFSQSYADAVPHGTPGTEVNVPVNICAENILFGCSKVTATHCRHPVNRSTLKSLTSKQVLAIGIHVRDIFMWVVWKVWLGSCYPRVCLFFPQVNYFLFTSRVQILSMHKKVGEDHVVGRTADLTTKNAIFFCSSSLLSA